MARQAHSEDAWHQEAVTAPLKGISVLQCSREGERYSALLRLEPESPLLAGHFPGHPILPGIAHLGLALEGARAIEGREVTLVAARGIRFRRPVAPGDTVQLTVTRAEVAGTLRFELRCGGTLASSGTIMVETDAGR